MKASQRHPRQSERCALCHQHRKLHKSHIIPEFVYRPLYDNKHRMEVLSVRPEDRPSWREQKGLREQLLCAECEARLSEWERYASLVLNGGIPLQTERHGDIVVVTGLDYARLKLFQLSILWRASVSRLDAFKAVRLGPHEETIRMLLLRGDPGDPDRYGCLMYGVLNFEGGAALTDLIVPPGMVRTQGMRSYRFLFGGFLWQFLVSAERLTGAYSEAVLQADGRAMFLVKPAQTMPELQHFSKALASMNRLPQ